MLLETIYKLEELFTEVTADHIITFPLYWKAEACVATAVAPVQGKSRPRTSRSENRKLLSWIVILQNLAKIYDYLDPRVHSSQVFGNG